MLDVALLFLAGTVAGAINAVAGGGTLVTFPMLIALGLPPIVANASNAVAIWPGHAMALLGNRAALMRSHYARRSLIAMTAISALGGLAGVALLRISGNDVFTKLVPPLIGGATLLFALAPVLQRLRSAQLTLLSGPAAGVGLFALAVYGGFFGAGLGVMLMAALLLAGVHDMQENNALKNLIATVVTTATVGALAVTGLVAWRETSVALVGSVLGGVSGGFLVGRVRAAVLRVAVVSIGAALTVYYSFKYYG